MNTAEDFISFYVEIMPLVQTLPLVLLHKELIVSKLLSSLHMKARLSLEPILRYVSLIHNLFFTDLWIFMCAIGYDKHLLKLVLFYFNASVSEKKYFVFIRY